MIVLRLVRPYNLLGAEVHNDCVTFSTVIYLLGAEVHNDCVAFSTAI